MPSPVTKVAWFQLDVRTLKFFPPAESWLVNSNFLRANRMQGYISRSAWTWISYTWSYINWAPGHIFSNLDKIGNSTFSCRGGYWGLRYCGIGPFFLRYFGNSNLELRYCGIFWTYGMRFFSILGGIKKYRFLVTFFELFLTFRLCRKQAETGSQTPSVTRVYCLKRDHEWLGIDQQFQVIVSAANYKSQPRGLALTWHWAVKERFCKPTRYGNSSGWSSWTRCNWLCCNILRRGERRWKLSQEKQIQMSDRQGRKRTCQVQREY